MALHHISFSCHTADAHAYARARTREQTCAHAHTHTHASVFFVFFPAVRDVSLAHHRLRKLRKKHFYEHKT